MITTLRVSGMTCNGCVKHVDAALREVRGVTAVQVDLASGEAKIVHDDGASVADFVKAVEDAGYAAA